MEANDSQRAIRRGLLELAVLSSLRSGRLYAAEILEKLAETPFTLQEGTLYPLLSKLRRSGFLTHEWEESTSGPPRKYHRLTEAGQTHRSELLEYWQQLNDSINALGK